MTRLAIAAALVAALLIGLVVALRVPSSEAWLEDLPGVGGGFEWLGDLVGAHPSGPIELTYRSERPVSPAALATLRRRLGASQAEIRGGTVVITAPELVDAMHAAEVIDEALRHRTVRVFVVVYQSPELDRIKQTLRKDDQAATLGLSVELDPIGYHVHAPDDMMYVNPAWAERHHCEGRHLEGRGTSCLVTPRERVDAYVHGDSDLFIDPHPEALALPAGRGIYGDDAGNFYELEATPIEIDARQLTSATAADGVLDLQVTADVAAAVAARASTPAVELVAEIQPGSLHAVERSGDRVSIHVAAAAELADDLVLAAAGLHQLR